MFFFVKKKHFNYFFNDFNRVWGILKNGCQGQRSPKLNVVPKYDERRYYKEEGTSIVQRCRFFFHR